MKTIYGHVIRCFHKLSQTVLQVLISVDKFNKSIINVILFTLKYFMSSYKLCFISGIFIDLDHDLHIFFSKYWILMLMLIEAGTEIGYRRHLIRRFHKKLASAIATKVCYSLVRWLVKYTIHFGQKDGNCCADE
jgi:hypothetical protein